MSGAAVNIDRIDFISSYCDRWCERCAFTSRCSTFAADAAIAMCGDTREGLELALGDPHPAGADEEPIPDWLAEFASFEMTPAEREELDRRRSESDARVRQTSIAQIARACSAVAHRWFVDRYDQVQAEADDVLKEALEIVLRDAFFIDAKLNRALSGRDRYHHGDAADDAVQNDWNGSAKVALIALERSVPAWRLIAQATGDDTPSLLVEQLLCLQREVEAGFPSARSFIRPGFDEPGR